MLRVLILICAAGLTSGIIVRDPLPHGEYKFEYEEDPASGDSERLHERRGGVVTCAYSVLDPDGTRRTVHYTADPILGFKAVLVQEAETDISQLPTLLSPSLYAADSHFEFLRPHTEPRFEFHSQSKRKKYFTPAAELLPNKPPINNFYFEPTEN